MSIHQVVLYKDYACNKCGSIKIDLFEAEDNFCFKCRSCNHNFIVPRNVKQKAKEEGRKEGAITFCQKLIVRNDFPFNSRIFTEALEKELKELLGGETK